LAVFLFFPIQTSLWCLLVCFHFNLCSGVFLFVSILTLALLFPCLFPFPPCSSLFLSFSLPILLLFSFFFWFFMWIYVPKLISSSSTDLVSQHGCAWISNIYASIQCLHYIRLAFYVL
jgi:hypothetical protein